MYYYENTRGGFKNTDKLYIVTVESLLAKYFIIQRQIDYIFSYSVTAIAGCFWSGVSSFACVCILWGFSARGHHLASSMNEHITFVYSTKQWPLYKIIHISHVFLQDFVLYYLNSILYIYIGTKKKTGLVLKNIFQGWQVCFSLFVSFLSLLILVF